MTKSEWISHKIKILEHENKGRSHQQNIAIAYSMAEKLFKQEGGDINNLQSMPIAQQGVQYNYEKTGNRNITPEQAQQINKQTGIQFTPEFAQAYFSTNVVPTPTNAPIDYTKMPIIDVTSDGQWSNRKVWRTQKPEWFVGKQQPIEGKDYTTIPYKQWETYQKSPEYLKYTGLKDISNNVIDGTMYQQGGNIYNTMNEDYFKKIQTYLSNFSPALQQMPVSQMGGFTTGGYDLNNPYQDQSFQPINYNPTIPTNLSTQQQSVSQQFVNNNTLPFTNRNEFQNGIGYTPNPIKYASENIGNTQTPSIDNNQNVQYQDWIKYNILNPYNQGMDLNSSLTYTGQQFGQGKTGQGIMGAGLSLLKGARNFLSGYASGKSQQDLEKQLHDKLYNNDNNLYTRTDTYQQGGSIDIKKSHEGLFTEQAHRAGYTNVQEFAAHVLSNPENYDATTVHRAAFAKNIGGSNIKQEGGNIDAATNADLVTGSIITETPLQQPQNPEHMPYYNQLLDRKIIGYIFNPTTQQYEVEYE